LASIDTTALEHNLNQVRRLVGNAHIWSVVKARAYGHSLRAALKGLSKTDGFALLDIDDARWLREQGWTGRLLLLEGLFRYEDLASAHELGCDLVVHREEQLDWLEDAKKTSLKLFLKLNSGMNRLGFLPEAYRLAFHRLHALGYSVNHLSHFPMPIEWIDRLRWVIKWNALHKRSRDYLAVKRVWLIRRLFCGIGMRLVIG